MQEEDFQSDQESVSDSGSFDDSLDEDQNYIPNRKRRSYVWHYFQDVPDNPKVFECKVCKAFVGEQTCNLGRHLKTVHKITRRDKVDDFKRGRPSRSFIWKYCTRENEKQAFCHLCKKFLYFGGGNTSNITKHLKRKHAEIVQNNSEFVMDHSSPELKRATESIDGNSQQYTNDLKEDMENSQSSAKARRGTSYVWQYCEKLSQHSVRCKLCDKMMSFHGTANVITHLQRKHNIIGKCDSIESQQTIIETEQVVQEVELASEITETEEEVKNRKRYNRGLPTSLVWKYCTRINKDVVRCCFCHKNLSYQGTSNLQRHLHRMHGVVASTRTADVDTSQIDTDVVWEHCTAVDRNKVKCNMCSEVFDNSAFEEINKHVIGTHGVNTSLKRKREDSVKVSDDENLEELDENSWQKSENLEVSSIEEDQDNKYLEILYSDLIVEDHGTIMDAAQDEVQTVEEEKQVVDTMTNPLSPQSSADPPSPMNEDDVALGTKRLQELREERVRMQSEYFREKAAYYRMQKYLTALQAKKARFELENLHNTEFVVNTSGPDVVAAEFTEVTL